MSPTSAPLKIGVIGPAGFGGSYLCVELINRGHHVVGLSRSPEKLGSHARYEPRSVDIERDENDLAKAFEGLDVVACLYGPHTAGAGALLYMPFIEAVRRIIIAVKKARVNYFIMVGGTGSLHIPHERNICVADSNDFFLAYRRAIADSHAHVSYMEERLGPIGARLREYRNARLVLQGAGESSEEDKAAARVTIKVYEDKVRQDPASEFIKAARASYMFFDGNESFNWTFVSPSALYRPGKRTGSYEVTVDNLPLKGEPTGDNLLDGRMTGITAADLAIAIADEAVAQKYKHKHWTATGDLSDDNPAPSYLTLG